MISYNNLDELNENKDIDVLIIGGGITGISCAYYLKESGLNICLVDQNKIGSGVTSRTTGKITFLQETIYSDLLKKYSINTSFKYLKSQLFAMDEIKRIVNSENIQCNLNCVESYVFTNKKNEIKNLKKEMNVLKHLGIDVSEHDKINDNLKCKYAISVHDTYVFHPLKYLYALTEVCLSSGINIYENTKIIEMKKEKNGYICFTNKYKIRAKKVIIACHYPFFIKPFFMPLKAHIEKSYVASGKEENVLNKSFISSTYPVKSLRYHKDKNSYFIYLNNSHNMCNHCNYNKNFIGLINDIKKLKKNVDYIWSNEDLMTVDKLPYIGRLEKNNDNLFIGTGYNTWGMTNGTLAGYILANMILGRKTEYDDIFNPLRCNLISDFSAYLINVYSSLKSIIENKIVKQKKWYGSNIKYEKRNGKNIAIYYDGKVEHIVYSTCPHMGCSLVFNEVEKTWDCPCHASRFDIDGKCIKGPSSYDISVKK